MRCCRKLLWNSDLGVQPAYQRAEFCYFERCFRKVYQKSISEVVPLQHFTRSCSMGFDSQVFQND